MCTPSYKPSSNCHQNKAHNTHLSIMPWTGREKYQPSMNSPWNINPYKSSILICMICILLPYNINSMAPDMDSIFLSDCHHTMLFDRMFHIFHKMLSSWTGLMSICHKVLQWLCLMKVSTVGIVVGIICTTYWHWHMCLMDIDQHTAHNTISFYCLYNCYNMSRSHITDKVTDTKNITECIGWDNTPHCICRHKC